MIHRIFKNKKQNIKKMISFGFVPCPGGQVFCQPLEGVGLMLEFFAMTDGTLKYTVTDPDSGGEYVLHRVAEAEGSFVGGVRLALESKLTEIAENCFDTEIHRQMQTKRLLNYAFEKYGSLPEFLWKDENAVLRRSDTKKWFAAVLVINSASLGLAGTKKQEAVNLHIYPEQLPQLLEKKGIFPAYHMNKKHWITLLLDGTVSDELLFELTDISFELAKK